AALWHVGVLAALAAAGGSAGVAALLCGLLVVRYRGIFFAMLNLALSMVAYTVLLKFYNLTGGSDGMAVTVTAIAGVAMDGAAFGLALFYVGLVLLALLGWA